MTARHRWTAEEAAKLRQACEGKRTYREASEAVQAALGWLPTRNSADAAIEAHFGLRLGELFRGTATPREPVNPDDVMRDRLAYLERENKELRERTLTDDRVRREILRLTERPVDVPEWVTRTRGKPSSPGVPTLFASDWHFGEVVDPAQIGGVNKYDLSIAKARAKRLIENTCDLVLRHTVNPSVPGIVFALGGDMMSGDIHEELSITNEKEWAPVFLELQGTLIRCIRTLRDEIGQVFVPCVTGNHARTSKKPRAKGRNYTNFDWLLYCELALAFDGDPKVKFLIPDGPDARYDVAGWRYLLTHGDQAKGGDGIIGSIGPVFRLDVKKRSRNAQIGQAYDTALVAHFHETRWERRRIQNGSLVGYNEFAANILNAGYEPPQQSLWFTHPRHGPTIHAAVFVEPQAPKAAPWVAWAA